MNFPSERFWFEPRGQDFVFRENAFSRGYVLTAEEKPPLLAALRKFQIRAFAEGFGLLLLAGVIAVAIPSDTSEPPVRFLVTALVAIVIYAPISILRQHRMVVRLLAGKEPTVDRRTFREAMMRPRPMIKKRHALLLIRLTRILFVLALAIFNWLLLRAVLGPAWDRLVAGDGGAALIATLGKLEVWLLFVAADAPFIVLYGGLLLIHRYWRSVPNDV